MESSGSSGIRSRTAGLLRTTDVNPVGARDAGTYAVAVKHVTIAGKSLLLGDDVADALVRYATLLGSAGGADSVTIRSIGADGEEVEAAFLLNSGTVLMVESTRSTLPEPDNADALQYMRDQMGRRESYELPELGPTEGQ
jgi:hypothetical protein